MKKFKISLCALLLMACCLTLTACFDYEPNPSINKVALITTDTTYYYNQLSEALLNAESGDTIKLYKNITTTNPIVLNISLTIDGQNKYRIQAGDAFEGVNLLSMGKNLPEGTTVTLKDLTLNANKKARVISVASGKLIIKNSTLTGGYLVNDYASGVFITNKARFEMDSGSIIGNTCEYKQGDEIPYYAKFSQDLWIGANATGSLVSVKGGEIGKVFVNANSYSANNPGSFTMEGGVVDTIYLEYDAGFGATFNYVSGKVICLLTSTKTSGEAYLTNTTLNTVYTGGTEV